MKLSLIMPVANAMPHLRECLDSVQSQTYTDWECLCVDGGSTDGSGVLIDYYAAYDNRFRAIHHSYNSGAPAARNSGLCCARGDYVVFVDVANLLPPQMLESAASAIAATDADIVRLVANGAQHKVQTAFTARTGRDFFTANILRGDTTEYFYRRRCIGSMRFDEQSTANADMLFHLAALLTARSSVQCKCIHGSPPRIATYPTASDAIHLVKALGKWYEKARPLLARYDALPLAKERIVRHINKVVMELYRTAATPERISKLGKKLSPVLRTFERSANASLAHSLNHGVLHNPLQLSYRHLIRRGESHPYSLALAAQDLLKEDA